MPRSRIVPQASCTVAVSGSVIGLWRLTMSPRLRSKENVGFSGHETWETLIVLPPGADRKAPAPTLPAGFAIKAESLVVWRVWATTVLVLLADIGFVKLSAGLDFTWETSSSALCE
jgi:hypothetical protein